MIQTLVPLTGACIARFARNRGRGVRGYTCVSRISAFGCRFFAMTMLILARL
jgi:hypothetical protein